MGEQVNDRDFAGRMMLMGFGLIGWIIRRQTNPTQKGFDAA